MRESREGCAEQLLRVGDRLSVREAAAACGIQVGRTKAHHWRAVGIYGIRLPSEFDVGMKRFVTTPAAFAEWQRRVDAARWAAKPTEGGRHAN